MKNVPLANALRVQIWRLGACRGCGMAQAKSISTTRRRNRIGTKPEVRVQAKKDSRMKSQSSVFDQSDLPRTQSVDTPAPGKWESKLPKDERNAAINIYSLHPTAEAAVEELQAA